jgi:uncharacterized spore protein YtfJ
MTTDELTASAYESVPANEAAPGSETAPANQPVPAHGNVPGYDTAVAAATKAGQPGRIDGFVERMAERVGGKASVRSVFGEPIERDGFTIIPVAKVRWGFGGGSGTGPIPMGPGRTSGSPFSDATTPDGTGSGSGGGGAVTADPVGYLEIGPDGASFISIVSPRPSPGFLLAVGATAAMVLGGLARLIRR